MTIPHCFIFSCLLQLAPTGNMSLLKAMQFIQNPRRMNDRVYEMVQEITTKIKTLKMEFKTRGMVK